MHLLKKTISLLLTLFCFSLAAFLAFQIVPGDSVTKILGTEATEAQTEAMKAEMGLDQPVMVRYRNWLFGLLRGDMGVSYNYKLPVYQIIRDKIPVTAALSLMAFALVLLISFPVGILSARFSWSIMDTAGVLITQVVMSIPPFFIGIIFSTVFGLMFRFFTPGRFIPFQQDPEAFWKYLFFPALAIALPRSAMTIKLLRNSIFNEHFEDYVRTAYSRGNDRERTLRVHVLRNALLPVITFLAMTFSDIVAGSIIIEQLFVIPGIGRLLLVSVSNRDFPVVLATVMIIALVVIVMNYLADLACQLIDPRTRMY